MNIKRLVKSHLSENTVTRLKGLYPKELFCAYDAWKNRRVLKRQYKCKKNIKVCFLVQMPEIWDKQLPVYESMLKDERFEPQIIVVPQYDFVNKKICSEYTDSYFFDNYPGALRAHDGESWINIRKYDFDYVFYPRPYDGYLPDIYMSNKVSKFSRCCYISYAYWVWENDLCGYSYSRAFFKYVYYAFMESRENASVIRRFEYGSKRICYLGYPLLENVSPNTNNNVRKVLWTPRWTNDEGIGGSHFFEFKDKIIEMKEQFLDIDIIIRPHPLAFQNYISKGLMTKKEVDKYIKNVENHNLRFDDNAKIEDTFIDTGVLITDISSIVVPFLMMNKPIIFCNSDVRFSAAMNKLMEGMYIAESWDDVIMFYNEIRKGNDYLNDIRSEIADEMRRENRNSSKRILEKLYEELN